MLLEHSRTYSQGSETFLIDWIMAFSDVRLEKPASFQVLLGEEPGSEPAGR